MKPPAEAQFKQYATWRLNKCIYGLTDACLMYDRETKFIAVCNGHCAMQKFLK